MNGPRSTNGKQRSGEGGAGAGYMPTPDDARSSLQYSALASLTPASAVMSDIPPISIAFGDYITCNPTDPEYARIANLLDNQSASQISDFSLQQQLHAVRGLLNQVDVSYVRFKSSSITFPRPSFEYAINPQPSIPQKRPFTQAMEMIPQNTTSSNIISQHQDYNRDIYQVSGMGSRSSQSFHANNANKSEVIMNSAVPQQIGYNQSVYEECILPTPNIPRNINHVHQRERQNTYSNDSIYGNSMYNSSDNQDIRTPSSLVFIETPAHSNRDYHLNVFSEANMIPRSYDIRSNSPHVVIESTSLSKSYIQSKYQDSKVSSTSSQEIEMEHLTPQVVINPETSPVNNFYNEQYEDSDNLLTTKRQSIRATSPKVVIEIPPRDKLEEYRSPQKSEFDWSLSPHQSHKKPNQEYKKHKDKDKDEERNGESVLINLINYMSMIFEAEDSASVDQSNANSQNSTSLFVPSSMGSSEPLLTTNAIQQLIKLVSKVSRYKRMEDVEVEDLARLLKILDRSVREVENFEVLPKSTSKSRIKVNQKNSDYSVDKGDTYDDDYKMDEDSRTEQIEEKLEKIMNGIDAAIAAFTIMTGGKLSKQLYPEDLITSSLNLVKNQLGEIIYRFLELNTSKEELNNEADSLLLEIFDNSRLKRKISGLLPIMTTYLRKLYDLMQQEELSDSIVITVSFIAIGPFFVDSASGGSNNFFGNNVESMKLVALGLLRLVFTNHQKQRTWILEEILTSLIKLPTTKRNLRQYRLPDGKSIQMVSALILQLIQSCTAGTNQYGSKEIDGQGRDEIFGIDIIGDINNLKKCGSAWKTGIDAASANAGYVFKFLLARCTKSIKNSNESEYRVLLDNFMEDVITVLNFPEWPAAEMIVHIFSKIMVGYINDKKADTYTKSMAIDYLGTIAGRIKKYANNVLVTGESTLEDNWENKEVRHWIDMAKDVPKGEITSLTNAQSVNNLWECQKVVLKFLEFGALEDPGVQCARQFYLAEWGYSFVNTLLSISENLSSEDREEKATIGEMKKLLDKIIAEYWQMSLEDNIDQNLKQRSLGIERSDISLVTELLATRQTLYQNFDSILSRILVSLDTGVVAFRTKALRALGQVVINDPNILSQVNVRQTIAQRLSDNSPAVRDAAIDLVGRYLSQKPDITEQYYKVISERILDTGLNVRKRVIKLLRDIYLKSADQKMMIDIGCKILMRINDDDNHVKDLALKTIQELWFVPFKHQRTVSIDMDDLDDDDGQSEFTNMSSVGKKEVLSRSLLIVGVAGRLGERNGHVLGGLFKKILEKDGKQKREVLNICQCMVDCLFEHLLTLQDSNSKTEVVSCISTICLLSNASPSLVRRHVVTLQPYLKSASSSDDQTILYYVLIIYQSVLPLLKRPNPSFLTEVEQALLGLLTKSPQKILQEVVPCLCVIVDKSTHNYIRLTKLLRSCIEKLKVEKKHLDAGKDISSARNVMVLLLIIGLLCKNFDFDKKRSEKPDEMKELNLIDKGPIITIVFQLVLYFCKESLSETVQKMALQSLGFIYLSYPIIMLRPESTDLMDRILNTGAMDMKIQLMKVFSDFLVAEQQKINTDLEEKKQKKNNPVDLKVLIGNADEFAEAGVSSSLMQRYLDRILECTFDPTQSLKIIALDVLGNIIQQGLAHPVLCIPTIVAIETSPEQTVRDKAFKLHQHLNEKHASLIHSRNVDCVKKAYAFQKQLVCENPIVGYAVRNDEGHPEALLNPMYSLLKEKRQRRNDFLISIVRTFDFDLIRCDESTVDVGFCKFVAENLATIDYKSLEEVLFVIYCINRVLSVVAISALHSIQNNAKILNIDMDIINQNKTSQEQASVNIQTFDENNSPHQPSVTMLNGSFMNVSETTDNDIKLNSMLIEGVQKPELLENIEKKETQEDSQEQESRNKDKETILPLPYAAKVSICMTILMYLKEHLKKTYALSEVKCQNFNPAQSGSNKDKPALRHQNAPPVITWDGLSFIDKPLLTDDDIKQQCELFRKLIAEDGTQKEEFADTEMEGDLSSKQSNSYASLDRMDLDITTMTIFDETTHTTVKPSGGTSSRKGIVRKLGPKSKNASSPRTSGNKKRNTPNNDTVSKKSKKKRKSIIDNVTDEEDSDFQL
ncbi:ARM repeat-containing protein [Rhizophagus irregularis]|uniref:Sister chromatid cohesion protein n=1 Tax=Rhizophagus irregularis TaxID=588596 RepID=A0A2N0S3C4_9GLOM|nr:ARM repeat-containing protein [Rhizophagus irregularis]